MVLALILLLLMALLTCVGDLLRKHAVDMRPEDAIPLGRFMTWGQVLPGKGCAKTYRYIFMRLPGLRWSYDASRDDYHFASPALLWVNGRGLRFVEVFE